MRRPSGELSEPLLANDCCFEVFEALFSHQLAHPCFIGMSEPLPAHDCCVDWLGSLLSPHCCFGLAEELLTLLAS